MSNVCYIGQKTPQEQWVHPLRVGHGGTLDSTATGVLGMSIYFF